MRYRQRSLAAALALLVALLLVVVSACSQSSTTTDPYGGAQNHLHDILALGGMPHTLLIASHYGLYRSNDDGHHWTTVAGTAGQQADGLMLYKLAQSPVNPQRVYVLAIKRQTTQKGIPGLYTSADAGRLFLWSKADGFFSSDDNGQHWTTATGIQGGIFSVSTAGATVYASGDSGLFVSQDGGMHFTLTNIDNTYSTVVACQSDPSHAYALVGTAVYATTDTGPPGTPPPRPPNILAI